MGGSNPSSSTNQYAAIAQVKRQKSIAETSAGSYPACCTMKNIRMLQQRVLLRPLATPISSTKKLFIPEGVNKNLGRGEVVATSEVKLRVGDEVLYDLRQTMPMTLSDEELVLIHESYIYAVFSKNIKKLKTKPQATAS